MDIKALIENGGWLFTVDSHYNYTHYTLWNGNQ